MNKPTRLTQELEMLILSCKESSEKIEPIYIDSFIRRVRLLIERLYLCQFQSSVTNELEWWKRLEEHYLSLNYDWQLLQGSSIKDEEQLKRRLNHSLDRMLLLIRDEEQNKVN